MIEYKVVAQMTDGLSWDQLGEFLNIYSQQGWELVTINFSSNPIHVYYFKKEEKVVEKKPSRPRPAPWNKGVKVEKIEYEKQEE